MLNYSKFKLKKKHYISGSKIQEKTHHVLIVVLNVVCAASIV